MFGGAAIDVFEWLSLSYDLLISYIPYNVLQ